MTEQALATLDYDRVIENLAEGAPTLRRACGFPGLPRPWQVLARAEADPEFAERLARATAAGADAVHDEIVQIETGVLRGKCHPAAASAALASKRWRLQRLDRKRWGEKVEIDAKVDATVNVNVRRFAPETEPVE